jgi:Fe-S-cluster-containing hydrogenase component 2
VIEQIASIGKKVQLKAGARFAQKTNGEGERYYFVVSGHMAVTVQSGEPASRKGDGADEYITYFSRNDCFSDAFLVAGKRDRVRVECVAQTEVVLFAVPEAQLRRLMAVHPSWAEELRQRNQALRLHFLKHRLPEGRLVQDFFLRHHYLNARALRVTQLDRCIACGRCETACGDRHGSPRWTREGEKLGRVVFPSACQTCEDARCMAVCRVDAMQRDEATGNISVDIRCTACAACTKVCPHGAIQVREVPYGLADFPNPVPESDADGATSVPGLYVIGDLAVGRAVTAQNSKAGQLAVAHAAARSPEGGRTGGNGTQLSDVLIVGAGPAGLSAAQECQTERLSSVVVDSAPILTGSDQSQRGLRTKWEKVAGSGGCTVTEGAQAMQIACTPAGHFELYTTRGVYRARNVIMATGAQAGLSLIEQAGVRILTPGSAAMAEFARRRGTRAQAVKCDGCAGYPDTACTKACPTASLIEIAPSELFFAKTSAVSPAIRADFSATSFVEGIDEQRRRGKSHFPWLAVFTLVVSGLVGVESFFRRTMPEYSFDQWWSRSQGMEAATEFVSSRGLGHVLAYVGTAFMLGTLLYSLRRRFDWFSRISKRSFLSFHIWIGIAGAAFVTYHSLFKLDRWVAISMWGTWFVVLTGLIGRYVYGWVHSQVGLTETEMRATSLQQQQLKMVWGAEYSAAALWPDIEASGASSANLLTGLFIMLWSDVRDRLRLFQLRFFGLKHITSPQLRRQIVRLLGEQVEGARRKRLLEQAKRILSWWNWIHIILTVVMFAVAALHIVYSVNYTGW